MRFVLLLLAVTAWLQPACSRWCQLEGFVARPLLRSESRRLHQRERELTETDRELDSAAHIQALSAAVRRLTNTDTEADPPTEEEDEPEEPPPPPPPPPAGNSTESPPPPPPEEPPPPPPPEPAPVAEEPPNAGAEGGTDPPLDDEGPVPVTAFACTGGGCEARTMPALHILMTHLRSSILYEYPVLQLERQHTHTPVFCSHVQLSSIHSSSASNTNSISDTLSAWAELALRGAESSHNFRPHSFDHGVRASPRMNSSTAQCTSIDWTVHTHAR